MRVSCKMLALIDKEHLPCEGVEPSKGSDETKIPTQIPSCRNTGNSAGTIDRERASADTVGHLGHSGVVSKRKTSDRFLLHTPAGVAANLPHRLPCDAETSNDVTSRNGDVIRRAANDVTSGKAGNNSKLLTKRNRKEGKGSSNGRPGNRNGRGKVVGDAESSKEMFCLRFTYGGAVEDLAGQGDTETGEHSNLANVRLILHNVDEDDLEEVRRRESLSHTGSEHSVETTALRVPAYSRSRVGFPELDESPVIGAPGRDVSAASDDQLSHDRIRTDNDTNASPESQEVLHLPPADRESSKRGSTTPHQLFHKVSLPSIVTPVPMWIPGGTTPRRSESCPPLKVKVRAKPVLKVNTSHCASMVGVERSRGTDRRVRFSFPSMACRTPGDHTKNNNQNHTCHLPPISKN